MVARLSCGWSELRSLRTREEKLIYGPAPRYYRVDEDPGEIYDLAAREPEAVDRLRLRLQDAIDGWTRVGAGESASPIDAETAAKLAAMGYLVGSVEASREITESLDSIEGLADPHEKFFLFDLYSSAMEDIRLDRHLEGISQLEAIVAADPGFKEAIKGLATAYYLHAKRPDRAQPLFEQTLDIDPHQEDALYFLGKILLEAGDLDGARERFEAILEFRPASAPATFQLGRIHMAQGDEFGAMELYRTTLDIDPYFLPSLIGLGAHHARHKEHELAGEYFRRAREVDPNHPSVLYNTAIWYIQEGNTEEGMNFLTQTIAVDPTDADAHYVLGTLLAKQGRTAEARQELSTALTLSRNPQRIRIIQGMLQELPHQEPVTRP
jgi:tetratricopeptide (TPR) repeat protein